MIRLRKFDFTCNPSFRGDAKHRTRNLEIPGLRLAAHPGMTPGPYYANRYAPPFSMLRWNAGRACMRDSQALRFG